MTTALLGYTGFVGTTLRHQTHFDDLYNSSNIASIGGKSYEVVVCAAAPAEKWKANQEPENDWKNIESLIANLKAIRAEEFILISTIDVYSVPVQVDEDTSIDPNTIDPYGKHRFLLEEFVHHHFSHARIVRLPGLFGSGLKKNFLFDMIHRGVSEWTHYESVFQFYNMANLWFDLQIVRQHKIDLINFATEPVRVADVAQHCFNVKYTHVTGKPPVKYDMHSHYSSLFNGKAPYINDAAQIFAQIRAFVETEQTQL